MERQELTAKLAELHAELSQTDQVDPASLERLRQLTGEIDRLLEEEEAADDEEAEGVTSGLKDLLLEVRGGSSGIVVDAGQSGGRAGGDRHLTHGRRSLRAA